MIEGRPENTTEYIQADRTMRTVRCRICGCVTHCEPVELSPGCKHCVHLGSFAPEVAAEVAVRRFDGADARTFFDESPTGAHAKPWRRGLLPVASGMSYPKSARLNVAASYNALFSVP